MRASVEDIPDYKVRTPLQQRHRDHTFEHRSDERPISVIITTLAAHAYNGEETIGAALAVILAGMDQAKDRLTPSDLYGVVECFLPANGRGGSFASCPNDMIFDPCRTFSLGQRAMSGGRGDADFSKAKSDLLARRAGYRCSVPGCAVVTIGPGDADDETASVGTAAHIHSASIAGPRGRGSLTDEQLASPNNGIWCCATHGREIDTNSGRGYQVATLRAWKALREDAARKDRSGQSRGVGWVSSITISRSPLFKSGTELQLEKCLFIEGGTSGKSSFFEWLAGAAGNNTLSRWAKRQATSNYIRLTVRYNTPEQRELEFDRVTSSYRMNNQTLYSPPADLSVVLLREESRRRLEGHDDLQLIAHALNDHSSDSSIAAGHRAKWLRHAVPCVKRS
jgi:hypothetical protein